MIPFEARESLPDDIAQWKICVVLPTRNEGAHFGEVIRELREAMAEAGLARPTVLIVDDSSDNTRALAHAMGVLVVNGEGNGLGYAMRKGLRAALSIGSDVILAMDGDGQSDPREIVEYLEPLARGEADLVIGSRFLTPDAVGYRYPRINRFGVWVMALFLRRVTGLPITDSHGGLRAMLPKVARSLEILGSHTYVQEAIIDANRKGFRIKEIPSVWRPRVSGRSRVVRSIPKYVMYTLPILVVRSGSHIRWPFPIAFGFAVGAFGLLGVTLWKSGFQPQAIADNIAWLTMSMVMLIVSAQLLTFGFLTDLLGMLKMKIDRLDNLGLSGESEEDRRPLAGDSCFEASETATRPAG